MKTPTFPLPPDRFGINGGTALKKWSRYPFAFRRARIEADVALMQEAGVRWVRVGFSTQTPLLPDTAYYLECLRARHIRVLGILWIAARPADLSAFGKIVAAHVRAYPDVSVWEAGNEPNLTSSWKSAPEDYAPTLQAVYEAVKNVDAQKQVASAGFSEWKVEPFLQMLAKQNAGKWMDIFAVHPYAPNPQSVLRRLETIKSVLRNTSMEAKPVWATEIGFYCASGWKNVPGHVPDEATKAHYLEQTFAALAGATDGPLFWYTFQETFLGTTLGFGLINWEAAANLASGGDTAPPRLVSGPAYTRYKQLSTGVSGG